jgi:hypothetical protein
VALPTRAETERDGEGALEGPAASVVDHAYKAQERLHRRYFRLTSRGKPSQVAVVAVARELVGFVWAVARAA